jgi:hypothetical protein
MVLHDVYQGVCKDYVVDGKMLKKDTKFKWNKDCQQVLDILKENMVTTPISVFLD